MHYVCFDIRTIVVDYFRITTWSVFWCSLHDEVAGVHFTRNVCVMHSHKITNMPDFQNKRSEAAAS